MSIQIAILIIMYIFIILPLLGRLAAIGESSKKHWVGYKYEACLERGFMIHLIIIAIGLIIWALLIGL